MISQRVSRISMPTSRRLCSNSSKNDLSSVIAEFNKEMETVFGEAPPTTLAGSSNYQATAEDSQFVSPKTAENELCLSHIGGKGEAQIVDVSPKEASKRVAIASCQVLLGKNVFGLVSANQMARIARITGAKQTSNLIPLCHNISLTHVRVDLALNPKNLSVEIEGEAVSTGKIGVEMEAMTANCCWTNSV